MYIVIFVKLNASAVEYSIWPIVCGSVASAKNRTIRRRQQPQWFSQRVPRGGSRPGKGSARPGTATIYSGIKAILLVIVVRKSRVLVTEENITTSMLIGDREKGGDEKSHGRNGQGIGDGAYVAR